MFLIGTDSEVLATMGDICPALPDAELKDALIRLMPEPVVIPHIEGGHLALLLNPDDYVNKITAFIDERN